VTELKHSRIWVIGASSGIGRAIALGLARKGARVAASARRVELLEALGAEATEADGDVLVRPCDVRDPAAIDAAANAIRESLGGIDALVYCAGVASLVRMRDAKADAWRRAFEINLMGASLATGAVIGDLAAAKGRALYLSSIAADDRPPRRGLGLYATHKAALNRMIECWQEEERGVSFTRVSVGDTAGTDMSSEWNSDELGAYVTEWAEKGFLYGRVMEPESVAAHVIALLEREETIAETRIVPRYPESA
jgi:NAD(P)-dependent dehydrogenase (short-subunit alcohol dehydrogenase family)